MHKLQMYENLRDMLEREVKELSKRSDLDAQGYDHLHKVISSLKDVNECIEDESMGEASYAGRGRSRGSYERSRGSYERGGQSNDYSMMMPYSMDQMSYGRVDGDDDGRYYESRDNFRNRSYRGRSNERSYARGRSNGQSYDDSYGYSRDNSRKKMVQKLETLMDDTMSEYERTAIEDCIDKIK